MTPAEGDTVAALVFTATLLRSCGGISMVRRCPCEYGMCGHCAAGRHPHHERSGPSPATHLVGRDGAALTRVWTTGRPCRWVCPCPCRRPLQAALF